MTSAFTNTGRRLVFEKLQIISMCLFTATLYFRRDVNQAFLIASLVFSLFLFDQGLFRQNRNKILIAISCYLIALISLTYSLCKQEGWFVLEKQLTLFILPLIYGFSLNLTPHKLRWILGSFTLAGFAVCLYLLYFFYRSYSELSGTTSFQDFLYLHMHHGFSEPLGMHATYLSIYVCFCISVVLYALFFMKRYYNLLALLLLPVFVISLLILSSRIVFIPFLLILVLVVPFFIRKNILPAYVLVLACFVGGSLYYLGRSTAFSNRMKKDTFRELNIDQQNRSFHIETINTDDATRAERWKCALELIREKPVAGYGTGAEKAMLLEKYRKYKLSHSIAGRFDSHNQYLAFTLKSGIFGLASFLLLLAYGAYSAFKKRSYFFICFLLIVSVAALTENILESNKGILFFAFFNTVFLILDSRPSFGEPPQLTTAL